MSGARAGEDQALIGAVDIGGTKIAVGVVDAHGRLLAHAETPTAPEGGFEAAMQRVAGLFDSLGAGTLTGTRGAGAVPAHQLAGIGIGCTGPVDPGSGAIGIVDFLPGWRGCNPVAWLARRYGVPVAMENDADAAALGEFAWGSGRGRRSLVAVTVGTGIGGGIVLDGRLYRGLGGSHPEIGHHAIDPQGPECSCGLRGCWEACARGPQIAARALQHAPPDYPHRAGLTARRVCELAREGDSVALEEVAREGRYLGLGIANLVTMFVPELIVLSGSVMDSADLFLPAIRATVRTGCGLVPAEGVEIATSALGRHAGLVGAAAAWRQREGAPA